MKWNCEYKGDERTLFVTLTFNQQNCQHPELHTPAARRCFRPYHPLAATSCGDCSIHPRIAVKSLHMLSLQHDSGNRSRPWEREALSNQDRYTVIGRQPSSPIRSCWYLYQAGSAGQLRSTMSSAGVPVAPEEAGWCYLEEDCEAWAWPSSLCTGYTSPLSWVCLVSGRTVPKRRTLQPPEGPISHGVFLPEDMEETGEATPGCFDQDTRIDHSSTSARILRCKARSH